MRNLACCISLLIACGCGYSFQTSKSALVEKENIHRVYVAPLVNNSYKPGVENVVYNALMRTLATHAQVKLVRSRDLADAVLEGSVDVASYLADAATTANALAPAGSGAQYGQTSIASEYTANLDCSFHLTRVNPAPGKRLVVWSSNFARAKPFPGANQLFSYGTTSALINESEFDRAISDIATSMMNDVDEAMLAVF